MTTPTAFDLTGRTAVVIGGARDLGRDMADALAAAGADVAVTSRSAASANAAATEIATRHGVQTMGLALDVTDPGSIDEAAAAVTDWRPRIEVLVNNAGGGSGAAPGDLFARPVDAIVSTIATNLTGAILCCRAFCPLMETGSVINIGSIAGLVGRDRRMYSDNGLEQQPVDYAAAKAGVIGMTRDLAAMLAPRGIRVNSISPGGFQRAQPPGFVAAYSDRTPLGRMGQDGIDLKGAALFLASDASAYVTGQDLVVDGGFSTWR